MKKNELIAIVARKAGELPKSTVVALLDALADTVTRELAAGREVVVPELGKFKTVVRAARTGRNPRTGETLDVPEKRVVKFSPAKDLRETIDPLNS